MSKESFPKNVTQKKRGRKPAKFERKYYSFWLRPGLSEEQDRLIERLNQLTAKGQRSRFIRRVLTTGDVEPVLEREFIKETDKVANALGGLASFWDNDEEETDENI